MAVDAHHPGDLGWNLALEIGDGSRKLVEFGPPLRVERRLAAFEKDFRFEHETVADDADARPLSEDIAQTTEEIRAVARQFLHLLRERHVQPRAEIGNARQTLLVAPLGGVQRLLDGGKLAAQCRDLLVENIDLRHRPRRKGALGFQRAACIDGFAARGRQPAAIGVGQSLQALFFTLVGFKRRLQREDHRLRIALAGALQREQRGEFLDLAVEPLQGRVLAGHFARQEILREHEDRQQENDHQQHGRQRVDKAGPVIEAALGAAGAAQGHQRRSDPAARRFRSLLISACCSACVWTQLRRICCSLRVCCKRP